MRILSQKMLDLLSAAHSHIGPQYAWHGRLMVLAWSVLLPLGILYARYFKVTAAQRWPRELDNRRWWHMHLVLQNGGVLCMSLAVAIVWVSTGRSGFGHSLHATVGWLVVILAWLQISGGYGRGSKGGPSRNADGGFDFTRIERGDHYDMTPRRLAFEWAHKVGGYSALALSIAATGLGLMRAEAPVWMWLTIGGWWALLMIMVIYLQRSGRCIDTYQAIWGPDRRHPGSARPRVGWGSRRYRVPPA